MTIAFELQKAVEDAISAALGVTATVYDDVPQTPSYPYVYIGDMTDGEWDADDFYGREPTLTLHTFSQYSGAKECKNIMDTIKGTLHDQTLTVTGAKIVLCNWEFAQSFLDPDGLTRHGVQRFRFILTEGA